MPIDIRIQSLAPGKCTWCGKERPQCVTFAFGDQSFAGTMCWNDLKRALAMKIGPHDGQNRREASVATATE